MATERNAMAEVRSLAQPRRRNHAVWLGVVITLVGAISYFMYFYRFPSLRDFPWLNLPVVVIGFILSSIGLWRAMSRSSVYRGKVVGALGFMLSMTLAMAFNYYIFVLSYQVPAPTSTVTSMAVAPEFTLTDQQGQPVHLSDYRGKKVVLTFYRGYW